MTEQAKELDYDDVKNVGNFDYDSAIYRAMTLGMGARGGERTTVIPDFQGVAQAILRLYEAGFPRHRLLSLVADVIDNSVLADPCKKCGEIMFPKMSGNFPDEEGVVASYDCRCGGGRFIHWTT